MEGLEEEAGVREEELQLAGTRQAELEAEVSSIRRELQTAHETASRTQAEVHAVLTCRHSVTTCKCASE